jgi:hypothetical protein
VKHKLVLGAAVVAAVLVVAGSGAGTSAGTRAGTSAAPERGLFAPGESLGGVRIGMTKAAVLRQWGERFGRCGDCPRTTWYFNYRPFLPHGVGVGFERGRVSHVFTVWQPDAWRTPEGLVLGDPAADIARTYGPLDRRECGHYYSLVDPGASAQSAFYVFDDEVWAFALTVPDASPCL